MNMKKILLFFSFLILCGCKANYYIDLDDNFREDVKITLSNGEEYTEDIKSGFDNISLFTDESVEDIDGSLPDSIARYNFEYNSSSKEIFSSNKFNNANSLARSSFFNSCFKDASYDQRLISAIQTSNSFTCFNRFPSLTEVTISIHTTKNVVEHNADNVSDNTYTWIFTKDNVRVKSIYFKFKNNKESQTNNGNNSGSNTNSKNTKSNSKKAKTNSKLVQLFVLIPLFFGALFAIIIFRQSNK